MATRYSFSPLAAEFPATGLATLGLSNRRPVLAFDASIDQTVYWTAVAPQGLATPLTCHIYFAMASATSGAVVFQAAIEAITPGDAVDTDSTTSFDSNNNSSAITVPGTAGYVGIVSITLTNNDGIQPGDYFRLRVNRDADNGSDTAAGDCYVFLVELRDNA